MGLGFRLVFGLWVGVGVGARREASELSIATISRGGAPGVSPSAPTHSLACSSNPEVSTSDGRLPRYSLRGSCTARAAQRCHRSPGYRKGTAGKPGAATGDPHHDQAVLWRRGHGVNTASRLGCPRLISISASASRSRSRSTKLSVASSGSLLRGGGRMPGGAEAVKVRSLSARCRKPGVVSLWI